MRDKQIISAVVLSVLLLLGVGGYLAFRLGSGGEQVKATTPGANASIHPKTPSTQPPAATSSRGEDTSDQAELKRLRAENERLRSRR